MTNIFIILYWQQYIFIMKQEFDFQLFIYGEQLVSFLTS